MKDQENTLCLNMIVKNESKIITRLLESVSTIIDCYCICDTGSTDNTIEIIQEFFKQKDIPGKIVQKDFVNFQFNRNYALKQVGDMSKYILLLDADMVLNIHPEFDKNQLTHDSYLVKQGNENFTYYNKRIIRNFPEIYYIGVTHEYINFPNHLSESKLESLEIHDIGDGGSKENKFKRDIQLFEEDLKTDPNNPRSLFYLANTYLDIHDYESALKNYQKHASIQTWKEELFYCYYKQGFCYKHLNQIDKMIEVWVKAWTKLPTRVESLYEIIHYYRNTSQWHFCKLYYEIAKNITFPKNDILFVHSDIYNYKLLQEYTIFAYYVGEKDLYKEFSTLFLEPQINFDMMLHNYKFYCPTLNFIDNHDFSRGFNKFINNKDHKFVSSTPSIIFKNNQFIMNLRHVNYYIHTNGRYGWSDNIITINQKFYLNLDFSIKDVKDYPFIHKHRLYEGIEDIKLLSINDKILFTGTCFLSNNQIGICNGEYLDNKLEYIELEKENQNSCEKNWVFLPDGERMIYKWYPLQIGYLNNNKLQNIQEYTMPSFFQQVRGSTNGFAFKDEIWYITHIVHHQDNEARTYFHVIVKFNKDMELLNFTGPIKFSQEKLEYCGGIVVEDERIIVSHSVWDRESYIKIYDKNYIESLFIYNK